MAFVVPDRETFAKLFDHTLLKPEAGGGDVDKVCDEALEARVASVCVNGIFAERVTRRLAGSAVATCTVVGFPLGAGTTAAKVAEAENAIGSGASEVDMVLAIGALKDGDHDYVARDIAALRGACGVHVLKVILETCLLTEAEKVSACRLALDAGADFVKTSTGFSTGGATVGDVGLMRRTVGATMGVKASGGIRTLEGALAMVETGATRIGASATVAILAAFGGGNEQRRARPGDGY